MPACPAKTLKKITNAWLWFLSPFCGGVALGDCGVLAGLTKLSQSAAPENLSCFSVQTLCSLCLCGDFPSNINHRDTENTEVAQRNPIDFYDGMVVAISRPGHDINLKGTLDHEETFFSAVGRCVADWWGHSGSEHELG